MSLTYADTHGELVEELDAALRAAVRRAGLDPQRDSAQVRALAARVVADHDQRSLTGVVAPVPDPEDVVEELVARVSGFGPLQRYLDDPTFISGIWPLATQVFRAPRISSSRSLGRSGYCPRSVVLCSKPQRLDHAIVVA